MVEVYCDSCGEEIVGRHYCVIEVEHSSERFHYHSGECFERMVGILRDARTWVEHGEGSGLVWRLVEAEREAPAEERVDPAERAKRIAKGTPIFGRGLPSASEQALYRHNIITLQETAEYPRERVAAIPGVGPKTLRKLDELLAEHGLAWPRQLRTARAAS
jgi:hypothetical protein